MFLPNDVIEYLDAPGRPLRILWIDAAGVQAYVYALGIPGAVPRPAPLRVLTPRCGSGARGCCGPIPGAPAAPRRRRRRQP